MLGLSRYAAYMPDYGGPVRLRMALACAERFEALIVQDAVAHNEGLSVLDAGHFALDAAADEIGIWREALWVQRGKLNRAPRGCKLSVMRLGISLDTGESTHGRC